MKTFFFIIVILLSVLWIYLSFNFFKLDNEKMVYSINYNNNYFEAIFFMGLFVFWFFLWRFFGFWSKIKENNNEIQSFFISDEVNEEQNKKIEETNDDNLKIIEWIWPKVEQLLKLNWINSIKDLSDSWYDELKMILERAWDNFKIINPKSWPYQAELADKKQWGKLKEYQDFLVWGVDPSEFNK